ncbi:ribose 5-phosphate isomerase A [Ligilactobacillus sp. WILCCON 0076]|uniref:Ribose 5-phosphate isomerase A n=1 Tax=Ligilactobacillus ubinensis TaxID=2876789 RepID=A0A9X2JL54_9LACO|nr:ribose 5-phosphate isomerase A [Ligilactobacillus ubinensis]MCP0886677.1 ribose 5-phosphate isomerase A [Ligilactobacillus ubinensis]
MKPVIETALNLIKPNMTISLGGGSNVAQLAKSLSDRKKLNLTFCTPSQETKKLCEHLGLTITPISNISKIDLAFDGCDAIDYRLNALKSNGGIHLFEKLYAYQAAEYIILTPINRFTPTLNTKIPLTVEVVFAAADYTLNYLEKLGYHCSLRYDKEHNDFFKTPLNNLLIDCYAKDWSDIQHIATEIEEIAGVVATSYFNNLVTMALTFSPDGKVKPLRKDDIYDKL